MQLTARQTERVARVLLLADEEAARNGDARVGTAHLLLALLRDERDHDGGPLDGVDVDDVRAELARRRGTHRTASRYRPWTPGAVAALDTAVRVAGDEPVGVRHLLRGVLADRADDAAQVLRRFGVGVAAC
ncbi:Clp protease N-terminal domain-containing protein [Actinomycetospora cinnamomea]|uniref:ClpA/ClpB-like protein n=1 Tax=Actinomycetospora cinnamomea TaxID=663609 RepID=A0A2U1FD54_9PSEU|nr:Clp protease N-terminal domain-containing protein [Actinomycetospora cinnamomea]PVZ10143.1 ClpA/ClpB-like protein [Actinomycetospora cinnamomea]